MTSFRLTMALDPREFAELDGEPPEAMRERIVGMIARLIDMLDELDGDGDREEDDPLEPSLGWSATMAFGTADDRECDTPTIAEVRVSRRDR